MRYLVLIGLLTLISACNSGQPNFYRMTEEELYTYNLGKPLLDKVYCYERREARSWIPRTRCQTVEEIADENVSNASRIDVLSPSSDYNVMRGRD
ncbi:MAG: hypothetical protein RLZZ385_121 [Pseudomonadota bacterium]|jgi:hypothetical protein